MARNPLTRLAAAGQSFWLDDLSRDLVRSGELARRIASQDLRGITSNPAIFAQSIGGSAAYDDDLRAMARAGKDSTAIYTALTTTDVREACDVMRPVYDQTGGADGYVSLEVSPLLARDTAASVAEGRALAALVDRPNLMIKIPGTVEGIPAAAELLAAGINVNITLLFSVATWQAVAEAHLQALERRLDAGQPVAGVASVASFFVSRIDTLVDALLDHRLRPDGSTPFAVDPAPLRGRVAIANAKLAYAGWRRLVASPRWQRLAAAGARPQRLLWASTGTKNPAFPDTLYVDTLIGPETVNTMPLATAAAFGDHGKVTRSLTRAVPDARRVLKDVKALGIDLRQVAWQLENDGIQKFIDPYRKLLAGIEAKRQAFAG
jgi:transaldolase